MHRARAAAALAAGKFCASLTSPYKATRISVITMVYERASWLKARKVGERPMMSAARQAASLPAIWPAMRNTIITAMAPKIAEGRRSQNSGWPSPANGHSIRKKLGM